MRLPAPWNSPLGSRCFPSSRTFPPQRCVARRTPGLTTVPTCFFSSQVTAYFDRGCQHFTFTEAHRIGCECPETMIWLWVKTNGTILG